jgi:hypothetical protein
MASLGTFGAAVREREPNAEPDTFEFCGETFTVHGTIPSMLHLTIAAAWAGKMAAFEGDAALFEALRHALTVPASDAGGTKVPADASQWDRFYRLAIDSDVEAEWLTALVFNLMAAEDGRPTERRSTSSTGSSPTSPSSSSSSSDSPVSPG